MKLIAKWLLATAAWALLSLGVAQAATLYITEYANIGAIGTSTTPWPPGPALATQTVAAGGGSTSSSAFNAQTKAVLLTCDIGCSISFGTSPTATTSTTLLQQGVPYVFVTSANQKVAVIANSAGNTGGGGGTVTLGTCNTGPTDLCKAEDSAHVTGDTGVASWGVVTDGTTALSAAGDYSVTGTDTAGNMRVVGNVASGTVDAGTPVKIGGVFNTTLPTVTNGQRVDLQTDNRGSLRINVASGGTSASVGSASDGAVVQASLFTNSYPLLFDGGTTYSRGRYVITGTDSTGVGIAAVGLLSQFDDVTPSTVTENQFGNLRMAADRSLLTSIQNTYSHIATSTTTTVKSGAGTLAKITVNTLGTVASTTTIYDSTTGSGTVIGVINTLALGGTFEYDVKFSTGLTLVTTGTVAPDITVSYK